MRKNSAFFSSKTHIRSQIRAFRLFEISFQPEYSFFLSFAQSKFAFFRHKKFLFFYFRQLRTHSANTKTQKHQKVFEGLRAAAGDGTSAQRHEPIPVGHWCQRQFPQYFPLTASVSLRTARRLSQSAVARGTFCWKTQPRKHTEGKGTRNSWKEPKFMKRFQNQNSFCVFSHIPWISCQPHPVLFSSFFSMCICGLRSFWNRNRGRIPKANGIPSGPAFS